MGRILHLHLITLKDGVGMMILLLKAIAVVVKSYLKQGSYLFGF